MEDIRTRLLARSSVAAFLTSIAASQASLAQDTGKPLVLEEVVVTAQKRVENVQDVPIAITAFQSDALAERAIVEVSQLSAIAPSVTLDGGTPFSGSTAVLSAFIRGIGSNDFAMNIDPGVGVYLDGVYLARSVGANLDLPDVERIEILKGPQGTLFGRNTIGGAISIVTKRPSDEFEGEVDATYGEDNRAEVRGFASIPITDSLSSSVAFSFKRQDGFVERVPFRTDEPFVQEDIRNFNMAGFDQPSREGGRNEFTIRGKLRWDASENFDLTLSADYLRQDQSGIQSTLLHAYTESDLPPGSLPLGVVADLYNGCISGAPLPEGLCNGRGTQVNPQLVLGGFAGVNVDGDPGNNRLLWNDQFISDDIDVSYATGPSFSQIEAFSFTLVGNLELNDSMTLKSITSYRDLDWAAAQDTDSSPLVIADTSFTTVQDQFSQELQLTGSAMEGRLQYVVGLYYFEESGTLIDWPIFGQGLLQIFGRNDLSTENYAVYGQVDYEVNDWLSFSAGGRYTNEDKSAFLLQQELNGLTFKLPLAAADSQTSPEELLAIAESIPPLFGDVGGDPLLFGFPDEQNLSFEDFSGRLGIQVRPADDILVYASWSQGYKTGGWTTRFTVPNADPNSAVFEEEQAETYELGIKSRLFSNRVQLNAAIFTTDYQDIQLNQQVGVSPTIDNQGDATISGGEIEILALITEEFSINMNASHLDATFDTVLPDAFLAPDNFRAGVQAGSPLPKTPDWKLNISPRYEYVFDSGASLILLGDLSWSASLWNDTERTLLLQRDDVTLLNLSATFIAPDGDWNLTVGGTNITNERYLVTGFSQPGTGILTGSYDRGSQWYVRLGYDF